MRHPTSLLTVLLGLALGACQPAGPAPAPTPTFTCTPLGATPRECSVADKQAEVDHLKLVDEAKAVYRKFFDERKRVAFEGGSPTLTPVLLETTEGTFRTQISALLKSQYDLKEVRKGTVTLVDVREALPKTGFDVALATCEDGRGVDVYDASGAKRGTGRAAEAVSQFRRVDGRLKIIEARNEVVDKCVEH